MLIREMLKSKIHRARVTETRLHYEGSISIDSSLMEYAQILPYEKVEIYNINNGSRFFTYAIPTIPHSGEIQINGAAARLAQKDDLIIIASYVMVPDDELKQFKPRIIQVNLQNQAEPERVVRET